VIRHFLQFIPDHIKAGEIQCVLVETIIPTVARILPQVLVCNNLTFVFEIMEWNEKHKNITLSEQFQNPIEKHKNTTLSEQFQNPIGKHKNTTLWTVPKSHRKIEAKRSKIDTPNTCMHDCSLSRIKQNYSSVYEKLWKEYKSNYNVVVSFLF
jgi:hypothetical protein